MGTIHTHGSETAPTLSSVLTQMVQQPSDQSPAYTVDQQRCQLRFKGPYSAMKDINDLAGKQLSAAVALLPVDISQNFAFPAAPPGTKWWVYGTQLQQLEAGDHAVMQMTLEAVPDEEDPSGGGGAFDPYHDTWALRWESYTLKPAAFCKNEPHQDAELTSVTGPQQLTGYADRQHVAYFMQAGKDNCGFAEGPQHYWYRTQDGDFLLNDAEELVLKKTLADKSALWHYPVLTHSTVWNKFISNVSSVISNDVKYSDTIGDKVDHVLTGDVPDGCPYSFPDDPKWQWVKTGDDMQHVKTKEKISFQRTETFMGVISADPNYYGNVDFDHSNLEECRWIPGGL